MLLGGFRMDAERRGSEFWLGCAPPLFREDPPGLSPSGGGVGGKTLRPITGGALESRATRLVRLLCTRLVAA
jgi:hypothetical protein